MSKDGFHSSLAVKSPKQQKECTMKGRLALCPSLAQWFHCCFSELTKDCLSHSVITDLADLDSAGSCQQLFHCSVLSRGTPRYINISIDIHTGKSVFQLFGILSYCPLYQVVIYFVLIGQQNFPSFCCIVDSSNNQFMPTQKNIAFPGRQGVQRPV